MRLLFTVVVGLALLFVGCSYSWTEGGDRQGNQGFSGESSNDSSGTPGDRLHNGVPTQGSANIGKDDEDTTGNKEITDEVLCEYLEGRAILSARAETTLRYFCENAGLKEIRKKSFKGSGEAELITNKDSFEAVEGHEFNISTLHVSYGSYQKGSNKSLVAISQKYCRDIQGYWQLMGPGANSNIQEITTSNVSSSGCDYKFIGKKIMAWQIAYNGHVEYFENDAKNIFVEINYFTEPVPNGLVLDMLYITVGVEKDGTLQTYNFKNTAAEISSYAWVHELAKNGMIDGYKKNIVSKYQAVIDAASSVRKKLKLAR